MAHLKLEDIYNSENKYHRIIRKIIIIVVSISLLLLFWEFMAVYLQRGVVPTPLRTWEALTYLVKNGDAMTGRTVWTYAGSSLKTFLKGFVLAFAVAFPLGLILGYSKHLRELAEPALEVIRPIAPVAWAPVLVVLLGYSSGPMMVVFVGIFFPLLTSVIFGVTKIDPNWINATRTLGATKLQTFIKVYIPSSIPFLMNGVKTGLGIGWMCIVSAELYSSPVGGLGFYISNQANLGNFPGVFAGIVLIGILGIITVGTANYLHKILSRRMGVDT